MGILPDKTLKDTYMTVESCNEYHTQLDNKQRWLYGILLTIMIFIAGFLGSCTNSLYAKIENHSVQIGVHQVQIEDMKKTIQKIEDKLDIIIEKVSK